MLRLVGANPKLFLPHSESFRPLTKKNKSGGAGDFIIYGLIGLIVIVFGIIIVLCIRNHKKICNYKDDTSICRYCKAEIINADIEEHMKNVCPKSPKNWRKATFAENLFTACCF